MMLEPLLKAQSERDELLRFAKEVVEKTFEHQFNASPELRGLRAYVTILEARDKAEIDAMNKLRNSRNLG